LFLFFSKSISQLIFGRVCPGKHLAHSTVALAAASVLSTFDLLRKVDGNGRQIEPRKGYKAAPIR
jgi:cytochrome P450